MPLIIHPDSRCDICLSEYSFATEANAPYAIPCGHVFCLPCLHQLNNSSCPMCRRAFQKDRCKRLHIDPPPSPSRTAPDRIIGPLEWALQQLAIAYREEVPEGHVAHAIEDVENWIHSNHRHAARSPVASSLEHTRKYRSMMETLKRTKYESNARVHRQKDEKHRAQRDLERAKQVETDLLRTVQEKEQALASLEQDLRNTRDELAAVKSKYESNYRQSDSAPDRMQRSTTTGASWAPVDPNWGRPNPQPTRPKIYIDPQPLPDQKSSFVPGASVKDSVVPNGTTSRHTTSTSPLSASSSSSTSRNGISTALFNPSPSRQSQSSGRHDYINSWASDTEVTPTGPPGGYAGNYHEHRFARVASNTSRNATPGPSRIGHAQQDNEVDDDDSAAGSPISGSLDYALDIPDGYSAISGGRSSYQEKVGSRTSLSQDTVESTPRFTNGLGLEDVPQADVHSPIGSTYSSEISFNSPLPTPIVRPTPGRPSPLAPNNRMVRAIAELSAQSEESMTTPPPLGTRMIRDEEGNMLMRPLSASSWGTVGPGDEIRDVYNPRGSLSDLSLMGLPTPETMSNSSSVGSGSSSNSMVRFQVEERRHEDDDDEDDDEEEEEGEDARSRPVVNGLGLVLEPPSPVRMTEIARDGQRTPSASSHSSPASYTSARSRSSGGSGHGSSNDREPSPSSQVSFRPPAGEYHPPHIHSRSGSLGIPPPSVPVAGHLHLHASVLPPSSQAPYPSASSSRALDELRERRLVSYLSSAQHHPCLDPLHHDPRDDSDEPHWPERAAAAGDGLCLPLCLGWAAAGRSPMMMVMISWFLLRGERRRPVEAYLSVYRYRVCAAFSASPSAWRQDMTRALDPCVFCVYVYVRVRMRVPWSGRGVCRLYAPGSPVFVFFFIFPFSFSIFLLFASRRVSGSATPDS